MDFIIVLLHFGEECLHYSDRFQKDMVSFAVREGADVVLDGHSHFLQPYEFRQLKDNHGINKQRLIVYSLGNFISSQRQRYADGGMIFYFSLKKEILPSGQSKLAIQDVHHKPVWVYIRRYKKTRKLYLLPVEQCLKNDQKIKLSSWSHRKMLLIYNDSKKHLENSILNTSM